MSGTVFVVVPDGIDDPLRPSGGNIYDRRMVGGLAALGWDVVEEPVRGAWPAATGRDAFVDTLAGIPSGGLVVVDGLVASSLPDQVVAEAQRLRIVVLVHLPLGVQAPARRQSEGSMLRSVDAVVTTSHWTEKWLVDRYELPPWAVNVAEPGADVGEVAPGTPTNGELLCVGAVTHLKGYDVLADALATLRRLTWTCTVIGSLDIEPLFADHVRYRLEDAGIAGRVRFTGALPPMDLAKHYTNADLLVLPSRAETYGMVVTEAIAHGLPVVASRVGGVPEALGRAAGFRPGVLVARDDPAALAEELHRWLTDDEHRGRLRRAARSRRSTLPGWWDTSQRISRILAEVA